MFGVLISWSCIHVIRGSNIKCTFHKIMLNKSTTILQGVKFFVLDE